MQNSAAPQKRKQKEKSGVLRLREINATVTFIFAFSVFALLYRSSCHRVCACYSRWRPQHVAVALVFYEIIVLF